ncbi:MAG: hypothetical protein VW881_04440 [Alphaproteobacteria bacterium]
MNDKPDLAALAREYLDLWEDQLTAMTSDPDLARQTSRFFDALGAFGAQANPLFSAQLAALLRTSPPSAATGTADDRDTRSAAASGTETPAFAPDDRDERLDQLARRVADLEKRIAELGPATDSARAKTPKRTRRKPAAGKSG